MARALTLGAGAGSAIALLLHAFDRADREHHQILERCLAPLDWHLDFTALAVGFLSGCLVYPIIEALLAYRWLVLQAVLARVVQPQQPLHRGERPSFRII